MSSKSNLQNHPVDSSKNNEERKRFNITESIIAQQIPDEEMKNEYSKSWPSLEKYVKVMTNLTLENFFRPLRIYLDQLRNNQLDPRDLYLYKNVRISPFYCFKGNIEHDLYIQFDVRGPTYSENGEIKEYNWNVDWVHTERLKKRSLLIFSKFQYMDTIDAVAFSCAEQGSIINIQVEIGLLQGKLELSQTYFMFEPTSYWNQVIIDNLLNTNKSTIPSWIIKPFLQFDFSDLQIKSKIKASTIERHIFDREQFFPFRHSIYNRLTLVNGAPGTGKSYLGRELVKFLIQSKYEYPIMLVTYKNNSLDSFLEKMSTFLKNEDVPFVRIGGLLRTKNGLIKKNDYFPKLPEQIQIMKKRLMFVNFLIIRANECIDNDLKFEKIYESTFDFLAVIDQLINIREIMYDMFPLYSQNDEFFITNFFDPAEFIPPWNFYYCSFAFNGYYQQLKERCNNKVIESCNAILEQLKKYLKEKGEGTYSDDIERIIENHFQDDKDEFLDFLSSNNDLLFQDSKDDDDDDDDSEKYSILHEIISQSDFYAEELRSFVDEESPHDDIDLSLLSPSFIKTIRKMFENLLNDQFTIDKMQRFMNDLCQFLVNKKANLEESISTMTKEYEREETERLGIELSNKKLIAITATRAAQFKESLNRSNCKFVIIEEAGELTEPVTFSIIPKTAEQIIMIGDYNQLRPKVYQELEKDPFNHHISLFEKEVLHAKEKNLPILFTLSIQRRMHPEISSLVRSVFYYNKKNEKLIDHEITHKLSVPNGFPNHLQFWLHNYNETPPNEYERSYSNFEEAKICVNLFLMMLCRGYKSSEITIITPYKGQKKLIVKELIKLIDYYYSNDELACYDAFDFENDFINDIRVAFLKIDKRMDFKSLIERRKKLIWNIVKCLDDFQGEENEVIILSLTRSSDAGFLRDRNRSLVALSRAKQMEIVVGNKDIFGAGCKNKLWNHISSQLIYLNRKVTPQEIK